MKPNYFSLIIPCVFFSCLDVIGGDEDNYGQEMAMYLNEGDIIKPKKTRQGIRRFCTPVTETKVQKKVKVG